MFLYLFLNPWKFKRIKKTDNFFSEYHEHIKPAMHQEVGCQLAFFAFLDLEENSISLGLFWHKVPQNIKHFRKFQNLFDIF